ncbi:MAG: NYN domain-containing protein [Propionibacteriaceae bacterium]|nr:NYN domain-containing protein [Propionibacteriaceae bacterium]
MDIENLIGAGRFAIADVVVLKRNYEALVGVGPHDIVVIGADVRSVLDVWLGWPVRVLPGRGPDGADLLLLEELKQELARARFDDVVIGSGDHIFVELMAELAARGTTVTCVSRHGSLSRRSRMACHRVVLLAAGATQAVA